MPLLLNLVDAVAAAGPAAELTTLKGILGVVIGVGALIFFHELGHFLAAKWAGVRVEVFSLGFGHRLVGFRHGGTDYRISALPLGGYVRMLGQADEDPFQAPTDRPDDFRNQPAFKRFVILVAGVVMNVVLAAVGFILAFGLGVEFAAPEIGAIAPGSPAARADLEPGDVVVRIDGSEILGFQDLQTLVALADGELELEVLRDGEVVRTRATPVRGEGDSYAQLGIAPAFVIADFAEDSPLPALGVEAATPRRSDRILNISPVDSRAPADLRMDPRALAEAVEEARGEVVITVERSTYDERGRRVERELVPVELEMPRKPEFSLGLELSPLAYVRAAPSGAAAKAGVQEGDRLRALGPFDDLTYENLYERVQEVGARSGGAPVRLLIERRGEGSEWAPVELEVRLELQNEATLRAALEGVTDEAERLEIRRQVGRYLLGVHYRADVLAADAVLPLADEDGEPVEVHAGDRLTRMWLDGGLFWSSEVPFSSQDDLRAVLRQRETEALQIAWLPGGTPDAEERTAVVAARKAKDETYGYLGALSAPREVLVQRGPLRAVALGLEQTVIQSQRILMTLSSLITGSVSAKELGGPIQIVNVTYAVAQQDSLAKLMHLLAILSVNLAVINILPIPVLDGGHILFLIIEKLKGRPVSNDVLAYAQWLGLFVILGLMALVFFNDIRRLVQ